MISNVNGMSSSFSKMPSSSLYFLNRIERDIKVNLGYWLAQTIMVICKTPNLNHTLCHILGAFLRKNFAMDPEAMNFGSLSLRPYTLDITCLLRTGIIREVGGNYNFYEPGKAPKEMRSLSRAEAKSARKLEMMLAQLDDIMEKLKDIEETTYKTRRNHLQSMLMMNHNLAYNGDAFLAFQNIFVNFMGKIWSMAEAKLFDEGMQEDPLFEEGIARELDDEILRLQQVREARQAADLSKARQEAEARIEAARTNRGQEPEIDVPQATATATAVPTGDTTQDEAASDGEEQTPPPPPPKKSKMAPHNLRRR